MDMPRETVPRLVSYTAAALGGIAIGHAMHRRNITQTRHAQDEVRIRNMRLEAEAIQDAPTRLTKLLESLKLF